MRRFFTGEEITKSFVLQGFEAHHIKNVLRLKPGDSLTLCDGKGYDYNAVIQGFAGDGVLLDCEKPVLNDSEPRIHTSLYLAYTKSERLDYAVQKSVELGVRQIFLFSSERCVALHSDKRLERLRRIGYEAAKQSGRAVLPQVCYLGNIAAALMAERDPAARKLFCYELETRSIRTSLVNLPAKVDIMCGPEGGFTAKEAIFATKTGWTSVSLGKRILRAETAPITALSLVMYEAREI
ncbi:ribosomal RNA small subunit methyltransferase E [Clostridia bacterium]|nr:ribosomal RNA small subunit methyltransferase E [Clostridia bacterium]